MWIGANVVSIHFVSIQLFPRQQESHLNGKARIHFHALKSDLMYPRQHFSRYFGTLPARAGVSGLANILWPHHGHLAKSATVLWSQHDYLAKYVVINWISAGAAVLAIALWFHYGQSYQSQHLKYLLDLWFHCCQSYQSQHLNYLRDTSSCGMSFSSISHVVPTDSVRSSSHVLSLPACRAFTWHFSSVKNISSFVVNGLFLVWQYTTFVIPICSNLKCFGPKFKTSARNYSFLDRINANTLLLSRIFHVSQRMILVFLSPLTVSVSPIVHSSFPYGDLLYWKTG